MSMLLAVVCVFGLSTAAFADGVKTDGTITVANGGTFTLDKTYTVTGTAPSETFSFTADCTEVTDAASGVTKDSTDVNAVTISSVEFTSGSTETKQATVTLPTYPSVGVYTYTVTETPGSTAGVTYQSALTLKVYVVNGTSGLECKVALLNGTSKTTGFTDNKYESGSLAVSKSVTGNMGDKTKEFNVTVTFTAPTNETVKSTIGYTGDGTAKTVTFGEGKTTATASIALKNGETITFTNIPEGVTWTVKEDDYTGSKGGYDAAKYATNTNTTAAESAAGATGSIDSNNDADTCTITNNKGANVDTGVILDYAPYALIAVLALAGVAVLMKKRFEV